MQNEVVFIIPCIRMSDEKIFYRAYMEKRFLFIKYRKSLNFMPVNEWGNPSYYWSFWDDGTLFEDKEELRNLCRKLLSIK